MDKLKELLKENPCYEQHMVSIKNFYEEHLFSILIPALYEGINSMYKKSYTLEQNFIEASKNNPEVNSKSVLEIFQMVIKDVPNLNTHKIRTETDRIKSSSKSADIFDDLVRAVVKANIILLTYNVDHKQKELLQTKYHENIIIHDFIHNCYITACRNFYNCSELFYHKYDNRIINQNKRNCFSIIKNSIKDAIRKTLPLKEILLEYVTQKYEQKDTFNNPYNKHGINENIYMDVNNLVNQDISKYNDNYSLLDDNDNRFDDTLSNTNNYTEDNFSLLVDDNSDDNTISQFNNDEKNTNSVDNVTINQFNNDEKNTNSVDNVTINQFNNDDKNTNSVDNVTINQINDDNFSDQGIKMIDISNTMNKKGNARTYFNEVMPNIQKRLEEYKTYKNKKKQNNNIEINRLTSDDNRDVINELLR
jgi:hypothetical protein